jgi:type IX secretion system PorP/SprF family membrane protein
MKKALILLILIILTGSWGFSQQFSFIDSYLINPVAISPAFSGKLNTFQALLTYRKEWTNLAGAPQVGFLSIDGAPTKNMGIGGNVVFNQAGIFRNFSMNLDYAYHLQVAKEHFLSFAINLTLYQNTLDLTDAIVNDPDDPLLAGKNRITETYFNAGTSLLYNWKELNICVAFPLLFNNKTFYSNSLYEHVLTMDRNWLFYMNYTLRFPSQWGLKFDLLLRQVQYSPWSVEFSTMLKYSENYWLGAFYRKGNIIGLTAGLAIIDHIVINYSFEFSSSAMTGKSGGTHEITLGYRLMKKVKTKAPQLKEYITR